MREDNRSLVVPTEPAKRDRYRRLIKEGVVGWASLVVLFIAPFATVWISVEPRLQAAVLVVGWLASLAILGWLMRNRREWVALMTPPNRA